jgi:hypothetical protein
MVYFMQKCPTCGRRLQICVEHLGRKMVCEHCHGTFVARDPAASGEVVQRNELLERADALLESLSSAKQPGTGQ